MKKRETDGGCYFDEDAADIVCAFFESMLHHSKGEWAGKPFKLMEWQRDEIIRPLFGWKRADGTRKYRRAYIELPRKNGKSTLASGLALYLLMADGEMGAEVYSAAADKDQAAIVFDEAKAMVESSPALMKRAEVYKRSLTVPSTRSFYRVLSADAFTKHGLNAHAIIFDELHAQPNRDLFDVLNTSTGARRQPLMVMITTAGFDRDSVCWEQHEYARQILSGVIEDDSYFAYVAAADAADDWTDPAVWRRSNPGMGVTVKGDYLAEEAKRAAQIPAYQNTFRRLHLNQWTQQETRWLSLEAWDKGSGPIDWNLFGGAECYGGLDLASTSDMAAFVLDFPSDDGRHAWKAHFWAPEDKLIERARRDRVPYDAWSRDGYLTVTPGNVTDYDWIIRDIEGLSEIYNIREIAFDRWGAFQVSQKLEGLGLTMVGFGQGYVSMASPMKELLRLALDGQIRHGGNPIMRWMADNMVIEQDAAGNVKPSKKKSREKIDGMVAGVMALDRAIRHEVKPTSIYEARGLRTL